MHRFIPCFLVIVAGVLGAADPWAKVHDLKSGTEVRIFKKGVHQPVLATFEEATDDAVVIATKKEEISIAKEDIERLDYRPPAGSRVSKETSTTTTAPDQSGPPTQRSEPAPTTSSSTNVSFGSKPDFETIYRGTSAGPRK